MFAKLFESKKYGQILTTVDQSSEQGACPCLKVCVQPGILGVCCASMIFEDNDAGWDMAERALKNLTLASAEEFAAKIFAAAMQPALDEVPKHQPERTK